MWLTHGPVVLLFSKFHKAQKITFFCKISVSALTSYASICPLWMRLAILLKIFATWQKTRFGGEQSSVVVMELHCGEVVMRTVTLCHQLSPQCIPWRRDLAHHSKMFLNQRWIQMQLQIWKYKQKCHNERPGASLEDVPPSKSKALCILQQCCTPKKSRSSSTIWTKYKAAVKQRECSIPDLWEYYCKTAGLSYNISQLKLFYLRKMKRLMAA